MTLDTTLYFAGLAAEAAILTLLLVKRVYRTLPIFCGYLGWSLFSDAGQYALVHFYPGLDFRIYLTGAIFDSVFQFAVLIEVSMSVLRPVRASLPRGAIVAVGIIIGLLCAVIWPFAKTPGFDQFSSDSHLLIHLQQTFSVLRIFFFLVLAGCSQLLSIGWRDRELQIATGLGFFSLASLTVSLLHTSQTVGPQYHMLDQMVAASYVCSILYWIVSFAQEVPERREFTPQMQNFLLAVAGSARGARVALASSSESEKGKRKRR